MPALLLTVLCLLAALMAGCGGEDTSNDKAGKSRGKTFDAAIAEAQAVDLAEFPSAKGKTLQQIAGTLPAIKVGLATSLAG